MKALLVVCLLLAAGCGSAAATKTVTVTHSVPTTCDAVTRAQNGVTLANETVAVAAENVLYLQGITTRTTIHQIIHGTDHDAQRFAECIDPARLAAWQHEKQQSH